MESPRDILRERIYTPEEIIPSDLSRPLSVHASIQSSIDDTLQQLQRLPPVAFQKSSLTRSSEESDGWTEYLSEDVDVLLETADLDAYVLHDILILHIKTFSPSDYALFQFSIVNSLLYAQDNGQNRLLIDLRDNGGGDICLGYSIIDYLFAGKFSPYGSYDFPAPPLAQLMATRSAMPDVDPEQTLWAPAYWVNPKTGKSFADDSWMVPPLQFTRNNVTSPYSQRVHDDCSYSFANWPLPAHHPLYNPSDIILLSHGYCGSTCAVFSKHISEIDIARTVTIGGLPGRPQSIASFPGGQVFTLAELIENLEYLGLADHADAPQPFPTSARFSFTVREIYAWSSGKKNTPLDFVFEASTFHAPYTFLSAQLDTALYAQVADFFDKPLPCAPNCPGISLLSILSIVIVAISVLGLIAGGIYYKLKSNANTSSPYEIHSEASDRVLLDHQTDDHSDFD